MPALTGGWLEGPPHCQISSTIRSASFPIFGVFIAALAQQSADNQLKVLYTIKVMGSFIRIYEAQMIGTNKNSSWNGKKNLHKFQFISWLFVISYRGSILGCIHVVFASLRFFACVCSFLKNQLLIFSKR